MARHYKRHSKEHKKASSYVLLFATLLLISALITVGVFAKYMVSLNSAYKQADAAEYYFLTDLAENSESNPYPVYDGTITFNVKNYDFLNISEKDTAYSVSIESAPEGNTSIILIDGVEKAFGTLAQNAQSSNNIAISVSKDGIYKVTATSSSPYAKTITLYFKVNTHYADSFYTLNFHNGWSDKSDWLEVDIYTGESGNPVSVKYGNLQPDNTISYTADWYASSSSTTKVLNDLAPYSHYHLIFFVTGDDYVLSLSQNGSELDMK